MANDPVTEKIVRALKVRAEALYQSKYVGISAVTRSEIRQQLLALAAEIEAPDGKGE